jgi:hypothetical protein
VKGWARYAAAALVIAAGGVAAAALAYPAARAAFVFSGLLALAIQWLAFAVLIPARGRPNLVLAAWVFGVLLRLGAVGVVALWLTGGGPYQARPALLTLVGLLTLLALLEPPALRRLNETEA